MSTNEYIAKLQADIAHIQSQMNKKGELTKSLVDEIYTLSLCRDYLIACLEDAQSTVTNESNHEEVKP